MLCLSRPRIDAIVTEPASASSRICIWGIWRCRIGEEEIDNEDVKLFAAFRKKIPKPGGYVVFLADIFMVDEWIVEFSEPGFNLMPYPYAFIYASETVPSRFVYGFPKDVEQHSVLAKSPGTPLDRFAPQFGSCFTDLDSPFMKDSVVISDV